MLTYFENHLSPKYIHIALFFIIIILILLGIFNRFTLDDAFISFRYAENFAKGYGLTWNVGEQNPVEGYTNFLWVLLIALGFWLKLDPIIWSSILSITFAVGTMLITFKLASILFRSDLIAILAVILLGTNYSFSCYMTGGLETSFLTFLVSLSTLSTLDIIISAKYDNQMRLACVSIIYALTILTRLDSVLICLVLYSFLTRSLWRNPLKTKKPQIAQSILTLPGALILSLWFVFKILYYGEILPNTFHAKIMVLSYEIIGRSIWYLGSFILNYSFIIFLPIVFLFFKEVKQAFSHQYLRVILLLISIWFLYIFLVGGDFMEYRFFIPILPLLYLLFSKIIQLTNNLKVQASLAIILLLSSANHAITFKGSYFGLESIRSLKDHVFAQDQNWQRVGIVFGELFSSSKEPITIATTAAGAIPYYSKLRTIDMVGLNDKWVAKNGVVVSTRPGHVRLSSLEYLLRSNVNLVIGHPLVSHNTAPPLQNPKDYLFITPDKTLLPETTQIIDIPIDENYRIQVLYLNQHKFIDDTINRLNLKTYDILQ